MSLIQYLSLNTIVLTYISKRCKPLLYELNLKLIAIALDNFSPRVMAINCITVCSLHTWFPVFGRLIKIEKEMYFHILENYHPC